MQQGLSYMIYSFIINQIDAGDYSTARGLLRKAAQDAAAAHSSSLPVEQHIKAMSWLFNETAIPNSLIASDSAKYIATANVPLDVCEYLVDAGIRIGHRELVSAAGTGVEGVQNWVEAHRSRGVEADLPVCHEAACCADYSVLTAPAVLQRFALRSSKPADIKELLVIAVNMLGTASVPGHKRDVVPHIITGLVKTPAAAHLTSQDILSVLQLAVRATAQ